MKASESVVVEPSRGGAADLASAHRLLAGEGLYAALAEPPAYLDHVRRTGRLFVARADNGVVVGFAGAISRGGVGFLVDLFVDPTLHGGGIGRRLLHSTMAGWPVRFTFSSTHPHALSLYVQAGMLPRAPLLWLTGTASAAGRAAGKPAALRPVSMDEAVALDQAWIGRPRRVDHAFWFAHGGNAYALNEQALAYTAPAEDGSWDVGPIIGADAANAGAATLAAVSHAASHASAVTVKLVGPHPAVRPLLAAGFRIVDHDLVVATRGSLFDWRRYAPSTELG